MTNEEVAAWLGAFYREHGFYPNEDPSLLDKGFSPDQALQEHLYAMQWGMEQPEPPSQEDYSRNYRRRYEPWSLRTNASTPETAEPYRYEGGYYRAPARRTSRFLQDYLSSIYRR